MYNFDKEAYFTDAKLTYDTRGEIERVADEVSKQGFKNIFFISSGGSLAVMQPIQYLLRSKSSIPSYCEIASEVILTDNKQLNKDSIVITSSKSGTTTETVEAIDFCNKKGIRVIAFCGKADTPVDQKATYSIIGKAKDAVEFEYIQHYLLAFRLLYNNGEFDAYEKLADQLEKLPENLVAVKEKLSLLPQALPKPITIPISSTGLAAVRWHRRFTYMQCAFWKKCSGSKQNPLKVLNSSMELWR